MESTEKQFRKRNAILACLRQSYEHPSADAVFESLRREHSDISRASVYRNLSLFKKQGLIVSVGTVNGVERFDGRIDPHVHFACSVCGAVTDVPDLQLPDEISRSAADALSCEVTNARLMLTGICQNCIKNTKNI